MTRQRIRPLPDLAATYPTPHDHTLYGFGHDLRVRMTTTLGAMFLPGRVERIADLSCGNGAIAGDLAVEAGRDRGGDVVTLLGDIAPGYPFHGPIEQTVEQIPPVDVFVCSETLEHLDDPDRVLAAIRAKAHVLIYSTPVHRVGTASHRDAVPGAFAGWAELDANPEHVWQWDEQGVLAMLADAGWLPQSHALLVTEGPYRYMIGAAT